MALPNTMDRNRSRSLDAGLLEADDSQPRCANFSLAEFHGVLGCPGVIGLLGLHLGQQLSWGILSSMLPQFAIDVYDMNPSEMGFLLSAQGIASLITRPVL